MNKVDSAQRVFCEVSVSSVIDDKEPGAQHRPAGARLGGHRFREDGPTLTINYNPDVIGRMAVRIIDVSKNICGNATRNRIRPGNDLVHESGFRRK